MEWLMSYLRRFADLGAFLRRAWLGDIRHRQSCEYAADGRMYLACWVQKPCAVI